MRLLTENQINRIINKSIRKALNKFKYSGKCYLVRYVTPSDDDYDEIENIKKQDGKKGVVDYLKNFDYAGENIDSYGIEDISDIYKLLNQESYESGDYILFDCYGTGDLYLYKVLTPEELDLYYD